MLNLKSILRVCIVLSFSLLAGGLTFQSVRTYGVGLTYDSAGYVRLARDVAINGGRFLFENKAVVQPPLYPVLLGGIAILTGLDVYTVAIWLNVLSAMCVVGVTLQMVLRNGVSSATPVLMGLLLCVSMPLTRVWSMLWTESVYILFVMLALRVGGAYKGKWAWTVAGIAVTLAVMTRYAGIVLLPVLMVCYTIFWFRDRSKEKGWLSVFLAVGLPGAIFLSYLMRNIIVSGSALGFRFPSHTGLAENIDLAVNTMLVWVLPWRVFSFTTGMFMLIFVLGGAVWRYWRSCVVFLQKADSTFIICLLFFLLHTGFIVLTSTTTAYDTINNRLLAPVYPALIVLLASIVDATLANRNPMIKVVLMFCLFAFFVSSPLRANIRLRQKMNYEGAGGLSTTRWVTSEMMEYIRSHPLLSDETLYSNYPDALYLLAGTDASLSPAWLHSGTEIETGIDQATLFVQHPSFAGAYLLWFEPNERDYLLVPESLGEMCKLEVYFRFSDGVFYKVAGGE